jgi:hypothetical protein
MRVLKNIADINDLLRIFFEVISGREILLMTFRWSLYINSDRVSGVCSDRPKESAETLVSLPIKSRDELVL